MVGAATVAAAAAPIPYKNPRREAPRIDCVFIRAIVILQQKTCGFWSEPLYRKPFVLPNGVGVHLEPSCAALKMWHGLPAHVLWYAATFARYAGRINKCAASFYSTKSPCS